MLDKFRAPEWETIRDTHPLLPWVVRHRGEQVARFADQTEAWQYVWDEQHRARYTRK